MGEKYDVFISYSRKDYIDENNNVIPGNVVSLIKDTLAKEGVKYWFDEDGIYSGQDFVEKIVNNIEASSIFLYLSTVNANSSKWTCKEIACANEFGKHIIPVRIDDSPYNKKVMFHISDLDYIEYYTNPENGMKEMITAIKTRLKEIQEENERKKEEERKKREAEQKAKEEAERLRLEKERLAKEEQRRIIADIELACTKLNNEEKKIELDRSTLMVSTEKVTDNKRKEQLRDLIASSPIRQKQQAEVKQLQDKITSLESKVKSLSDERERLDSKLKGLESNKDNEQDKALIDRLKKDLATAEEKSRKNEKNCQQLSQQIEELQKQPKDNLTKTSNKRLHFIYGACILALLIGSGIGIYLNTKKTKEIKNELIKTNQRYNNLLEDYELYESSK